jgi:hypothetical protein
MRRLVTVVVVLLGAAACSGTDTPSAQPNQSPAGKSATEESEVTPIRITVDNRPITAQLADNPTAQGLADQLPLTLTFRDLNRTEKFAPLPRPLTTEEAPKATIRTSPTSDIGLPMATWSSITATSATGTGSSGSDDSTRPISSSSEANPTASKSPSNGG